MDKDKILEEKAQEVWGCATLTIEQCKTCAWSKGPAPWADAPEKSYCLKYPRSKYIGKPSGVLYHGEECEYHTTEEERKAAEERIKREIEQERANNEEA